MEIDNEIEGTAYTYVFAFSISSGEEEDYEEDLEDLFDMRDHISSYRYLSRDASAGRLNSDVFEVYIHDYPGTAFLAMPAVHYSTCTGRVYRGIWGGVGLMNNQST